MREAINFSFDGIASEDMGVIIASPDGGLFEETFLPDRSIVETKVANQIKPYFQRVESEPLSFSLTFFIHEWRDRLNLRQIAKWLMKDYYAPLIFDTNSDRIFYAIFEGSSSLFHNGCKDGYITLNVRCNSPFTYSQLQAFETMEVRDLDKKNQRFSVLNSGDMTIQPKMRITKRNAKGDISIKNEITGQLFTLKNLTLDEQVFIDMEHEEIVSDMEYLNVYRYGDHNGVWIDFIEDENILVCTGDFDLEIEYQNVYLAD